MYFVRKHQLDLKKKNQRSVGNCKIAIYKAKDTDDRDRFLNCK